MHELSIVLSILETAEKFIVENNASKVSKIVLQVGELSGIESQYIKECFPLAIAGTVLEGSELEIKTVRTRLLCMDCETVFNPKKRDFKCPNCSSSHCNIIDGRDVLIEEIEIEESSASDIEFIKD